MEMFKFDESFVAGVRRVMPETSLPPAPVKMPEGDIRNLGNFDPRKGR